jgi:hypothetical protein
MWGKKTVVETPGGTYQQGQFSDVDRSFPPVDRKTRREKEEERRKWEDKCRDRQERSDA